MRRSIPVSHRVYWFVVAFLFGVFGAWFLEDARGWFLVESLVLFVYMFGGYLARGYRFSAKVFFLLVLAGALGIWRFFSFAELSAGHISEYVGDVKFRGCIAREVDVRSDKVKYVFDVEEVFFEEKWKDSNGFVLVSGPRYPVYQYGECLEVMGWHVLPGKIEDFNYDDYLSRYEIYSVVYRPNFEEWGSEYGAPGGRTVDWMSGILKFKAVVEGRLGEIYAEPEASFMAGLVLGSRRGIPDELMANFNTTGLTHIIAISGYNITLIIVLVSNFFSFLGKRQKIVASAFVVCVFVVLVGASAAVVRAAIMGVISLMALWFGREYSVGVGIFVAVLLMVYVNPRVLVFDVGFQLSVLATCGLVYVSPFLEKYFLWLPKKFGIRESIVMTLSAQVLALPVIVFDFGRLSLISPIANMFVLPLIPISMFAGVLAVVASFLWWPLGMLVGFCGFLVLRLAVFFVDIFAKIPLASVDVYWFSAAFMLLYFLLIWRWLLRRYQ